MRARMGTAFGVFLAIAATPTAFAAGITLADDPQPTWIRPQLTQLGKSDAYTDVQSTYGWGTEPLFALGVCGYIAHGTDDDHVYWVGQFPAPTTIYGIRFHTWQGSDDQPHDLAFSERFEFRDTPLTGGNSDSDPTMPGPPPFLVIDSPVPYKQDFVMQGMLETPVTVSNLRIDAESEFSWVDIGMLEILTNPGTAGQPPCS
jgi:hypothetical protein